MGIRQNFKNYLRGKNERYIYIKDLQELTFKDIEERIPRHILISVANNNKYKLREIIGQYFLYINEEEERGQLRVMHFNDFIKISVGMNS